MEDGVFFESFIPFTLEFRIRPVNPSSVREQLGDREYCLAVEHKVSEERGCQRIVRFGVAWVSS
jgi:hypothetical protein